MPRRRRRPETEDATLPAETRTTATPTKRAKPARGGSRLLRRLGWTFLALLVAIFFLPNIIGMTPLGQIVLDKALKDFKGRVTVQSLSLGWLQPIRVGGLKVADVNGNTLAEVESIASTQRLINFLYSSQLGNFEIVRPKIQLVTREGGSNFEDAIVKYMEMPPSEKSEPLPNVSVHVTEGAISIASQNDPAPWTLDQINAAIDIGKQRAISGNIKTRIVRGEQVGDLSADIVFDDQQTAITGDNGSVKLQANQAALGFLAPLLERVIGPVTLNGNLGGELSAQFDGAGQNGTVSFDATNITDLQFACKEFLGADVIQISKLVAAGEISCNSKGVTAKQLAINSDVGDLSTDGKIEWAQFQQLTESGNLVETPFQLDGHIDLARITQLLPQTLKLYEDVLIESGDIRCQLNSRPENGSGRIVVNVDTANLVAIRGGQRLAWQQPLRLVSTVSERRGNWQLDEVLVQSDFLTIQGQATQTTGKFETQGDLSVLMQRLGQFIDVRGWSVQGKIDGNFGWQVASTTPPSGNLSLVNQPLEFGGQFTVTEPLVAMPGLKPWRESKLVANIEGTATALVSGSTAVDQGSAVVEIGQEKLQIKLSEPIPDLAKQSNWTAQCTLSGGLAKWLAHAGTFVDLSFLNTDGQTQVTCTALVDDKQILFSDVHYQLQNWAFDGYGMSIREPEVTGDGVLRYDMLTGQLQLPEITFVSSSVAARGDTITLDVAKFLDVRGDVAYRADLHRVLNWFGLFSTPGCVHYFGGAEGNLRLDSTADAIIGQVKGKVVDFIAAQQAPAATTATAVATKQEAAWSELLRETEVAYQSKIGLSQDFNRLTFQGLEAVASSLKLKADGSISDLANTMNSDITGQWSPDWQQVQKLLDAYTSKLVQLTGRQQQNFVVKGPLFSADPKATWPPKDLTITSQITWQQGVVCMLPVGAADISASLNQGTAILDTGIIPFSGGQVRLAPHFDLNDAQQRVVLSSGPIATDITLTPEICRDWMKFVAPLIADVTSAEGKISVTSAGVEVPLSNLNGATGNGEITLSDVTVGAGPLGKKLIETVENLRTILKPGAAANSKDRSVWMRLEQQSVPIAVANGRVFHDGMKIVVKDVTLRTKGSVGFDQSLSMSAEIPILEEWIKGESWLEGLKGQSITIPITGTLTNPKLDLQSLQKLSMNLVQRTAANKLNGLVNEQTQKLQSKVGGEVGKLQDKLGGELNKVQSGVQEKLQGEVLKGFDQLFGPKKDK